MDASITSEGNDDIAYDQGKELGQQHEKSGFSDIEIGELPDEEFSTNYHIPRKMPLPLCLSDNCDRAVTNNSSQLCETHQGRTIHTCAICHKSFNRGYHLKRHSRSHTGEKPYQCDACDKSYSRSYHLKRHYRIHTGEKPYRCEICDRRFSLRSSLKVHMLTHSGKKTYNSTLNGIETFPNLGQLLSCEFHQVITSNRDIDYSINIEQKLHTCETCGKSFNRISHFYRHIRSHTGEKPHKCNFCEKRFSQRSDLKRHLMIHFGEKKYKCDICDKQFTEKGNLKRHSNIHKGEKPHLCNICDEEFTLASDFKTHLMTHCEENLDVQSR